MIFEAYFDKFPGIPKETNGFPITMTTQFLKREWLHVVWEAPGGFWCFSPLANVQQRGPTQPTNSCIPMSGQLGKYQASH